MTARKDIVRRSGGTQLELNSHTVSTERGLPYAAEVDTKMRLALEINRQLTDQRLTQAAAAARLSINQPKVSALKHYRLDGFSVERLMGFLTALGSDIEIRIWPPKKSPGQIRVEST